MKTVMYNGQEVEAVDCTPKWEELAESMLARYAFLVNKNNRSEDETKSMVNLHRSFLTMAVAADKFNVIMEALKPEIKS